MNKVERSWQSLYGVDQKHILTYHGGGNKNSKGRKNCTIKPCKIIKLC